MKVLSLWFVVLRIIAPLTKIPSQTINSKPQTHYLCGSKKEHND